MRHEGIVMVMLGTTILLGCANPKEGAASGGAAGAVAGGAAGGAAAGAPVAGVGAIIGGALGAAGGAIVGARNEYNNDKYREQALRSARGAESSPAQASAVVAGGTADINNDGFVTTDEIIALKKAGLSDDEIIERLRTTQQVFGLTRDQERKLLDNGISPRVIDAMRNMSAEMMRPPAP